VATATSQPFNARTVVGLIVAGILAFIALMLLLAFGDRMGSRTSGRANALSVSAVGFKGLVDLSGRLRHSYLIRDNEQYDATNLVVIAIEPRTRAAELRRILEQRANRPTLIILPKWFVERDPQRNGWVRAIASGVGAMATRELEWPVQVRTLEGAADRAGRNIAGTGPLIGLTLPLPRAAQTVSGQDLTPLLPLEPGAAAQVPPPQGEGDQPQAGGGAGTDSSPPPIYVPPPPPIVERRPEPRPRVTPVRPADDKPDAAADDDKPAYEDEPYLLSHTLRGLPLPWGEGRGEGVQLSRGRTNPSPIPSPHGRGFLAATTPPPVITPAPVPVPAPDPAKPATSGPPSPPALLAQLGSRPHYLLADPDLLNNQALRDPTRARVAIGLLDRLNAPGESAVGFDLTMNGYGSGEGRSVMRMAFEPPFLAMTLALFVAALLAGLHGAFRFGPARREARAIAFGKAALVENSAGLIRLADREANLGGAYADVMRQEMARAAAAPGHLQGEALDRYLNRLARDGPSFSELAADLDRASDRSGLMNAARRIWDWRKTVLR